MSRSSVKGASEWQCIRSAALRIKSALYEEGSSKILSGSMGSYLGLKILNGLLLTMFRAGAGAFPSMVSVPGAVPRFKNRMFVGCIQLEECRLPLHRRAVPIGPSPEPSGSWSLRGNEWLCPAFKEPRRGGWSGNVFPHC